MRKSEKRESCCYVSNKELSKMQTSKKTFSLGYNWHIILYHFQVYIIMIHYLCIHCKMVTISLLMSVTIHSHNFFLVMRSSKLSYLSNSQAIQYHLL